MIKDNLTAYIDGESNKKPLWLMRQAGRYLPEYKKIRKEAGDFLSLCYNPEYAKIVTLQPIERFDFDAAILFSDILVIPHALGQELWFEENEGPKLNNKQLYDIIEKGFDIASFDKALEPVYDAISLIRKNLSKEKH